MKSYFVAIFALVFVPFTARPVRALDADSELVRSLAGRITRTLPAEAVAAPVLESHAVAPTAATMPAAFGLSPSTTLDFTPTAMTVAPVPSERRSIAFPMLASTYVALNAIDIYTTTKAIGNGRGTEANPLLGSVSGTPAALTAAKIATTATTLILAKHLWKEHRAASVALLVAANVGMGFVVQHNARVAGGF